MDQFSEARVLSFVASSLWIGNEESAGKKALIVHTYTRLKVILS